MFKTNNIYIYTGSKLPVLWWRESPFCNTYAYLKYGEEIDFCLDVKACQDYFEEL